MADCAVVANGLGAGTVTATLTLAPVVSLMTTIALPVAIPVKDSVALEIDAATAVESELDDT
jgi:hypothetical protein